MIIQQVLCDTNEYFEILKLRQKILRTPLGLQYSKTDLQQDEHSIILALYDDFKLCGCLFIDSLPIAGHFKLRQMAIDTEFQGQGYGTLLMHSAEKKILSLQGKQIELHARKTATSFYSKLGYLSIGTEFVEVTIPHIKMLKTLSHV